MNNEMKKHIETLMKNHKHKYEQLSNGDLKLLDTAISHHILSISTLINSPSIKSLMFVGIMNTVMTLNISQEDLPLTFELFKQIKEDKQ